MIQNLLFLPDYASNVLTAAELIEMVWVLEEIRPEVVESEYISLSRNDEVVHLGILTYDGELWLNWLEWLLFLLVQEWEKPESQLASDKNHFVSLARLMRFMPWFNSHRFNVHQAAIHHAFHWLIVLSHKSLQISQTSTNGEDDTSWTHAQGLQEALSLAFRQETTLAHLVFKRCCDFVCDGNMLGLPESVIQLFENGFTALLGADGDKRVVEYRGKKALRKQPGFVLSLLGEFFDVFLFKHRPYSKLAYPASQEYQLSTLKWIVSYTYEKRDHLQGYRDMLFLWRRLVEEMFSACIVDEVFGATNRPGDPETGIVSEARLWKPMLVHLRQHIESMDEEYGE